VERSGFVSNEVLDTIIHRRSIYRFTPESIPEEKIVSILEAGRWAPSYANTQPWEFIIVRDPKLKDELVEITRMAMAAHAGIEGAQIIIVTCVNPKKDEYHFIEDGAVATQNMALAAHSLGLASYWVGIFDLANAGNSLEKKIKRVLNVPNQLRVISLLPLGVPAYSTEKQRRRLDEICHNDKYAGGRTAAVEGQGETIGMEAPRHGQRAQMPPAPT
jgi:nitroreductase